MSEISNTIQHRAQILADFMTRLAQGENGAQLVKEYDILNIQFIPKDILPAFDILMERIKDINTVKTVSNKIFNLLYKILKSYPALEPQQNTLLYFIKQDNQLIDKHLQQLRPLQKKFIQTGDTELLTQIKLGFEKLQNISHHYTLLQNIIFPIAEKHWENHQCLSLLWHIQDLVVEKIKKLLNILSTDTFDEKLFHKTSAEIFFDTYTLIFRENHVLIPVLLETINTDEIDANFDQAAEIGLAFVDIHSFAHKASTASHSTSQGLVDLGTGSLTPEQISLIFSHLPVDITYVDENDQVKFFSDAPHRIFPRTKAIIGRKVQNCHPPDSVHIVNKIVDEFRRGTRDKATFWIHFRDKYLLIQYFAVRDKQGNYRGVLEVTQDISEHQKISGEKRLLDWE